MIWRRRIPAEGETRRRIRFAWLPVRFTYEGERVTCWLTSYVEESPWRSAGDCSHNICGHWCSRRGRRLLVSDAALEKLNPEPAKPVQANVPPPASAGIQLTQAQIAALMAGQSQFQQQMQQYQQAKSLAQLGKVP